MLATVVSIALKHKLFIEKKRLSKHSHFAHYAYHAYTGNILELPGFGTPWYSGQKFWFPTVSVIEGFHCITFVTTLPAGSIGAEPIKLGS